MSFTSSRRAAMAALVVAAGLVAAVPPSSGQTAPPVLRPSENRRLATGNDILRAKDGPGLAVDPADPRHIVGSEVDPRSGQCHYSVSFDGGTTWTGGTLRAPAAFGRQPCLGFDEGGYLRMDGGIAYGSGQNVYVAFSAAKGNEGDTTLVARSTDGGRTYAEAVPVLVGGPAGNEPSFIRPKVGVQRRAGADRVIVEAWGLSTSGPATFEGQRRK